MLGESELIHPKYVLNNNAMTFLLYNLRIYIPKRTMKTLHIHVRQQHEGYN